MATVWVENECVQVGWFGKDEVDEDLNSVDPLPGKIYFRSDDFPAEVVFQNPNGILGIVESWIDTNIPGLINRDTSDGAPTGSAKIGGGARVWIVVFCSREPTPQEIELIRQALENVQPV